MSCMLCEDPGAAALLGPAMAVTITLKTLQQQTFKIRMEPDETVKVLKEKIEAEKGRDAFPVAGQKLIYAGKILSDDIPIKEYHIDEKNFVVVMVTKAKAGQGTPAPQRPHPLLPRSPPHLFQPQHPACLILHLPTERTRAHQRSQPPQRLQNPFLALFPFR